MKQKLILALFMLPVPIADAKEFKTEFENYKKD